MSWVYRVPSVPVLGLARGAQRRRRAQISARGARNRESDMRPRRRGGRERRYSIATRGGWNG